MIRYGDQNTRTPYVETDEFSHGGDPYFIRVTALPPYKNYEQGRDELYCHIDFRNENTGVTGRYSETWIDARNPGEVDGQLRRHSTYRTLRRLLQTTTADPSPIF